MTMRTTKASKFQNIPIINGNLFDHIEQHIYQQHNGSTIIVPHVCNNLNLFGAGFAAAVADHYPIVKENYHLLGNTFLKNNLGYTQFVTVKKEPVYGHQIIFANMIAQNGVASASNTRPLNYFYLAQSMYKVAHFIHTNFDIDNKVQIHAPKFGCGLAGGNWNFIKDLINDIWNKYPIFIYQL